MNTIITADDFDRFNHLTLQALIFAESIVDAARRLHPDQTGLPRTVTTFSPDGEPREIRLRDGRTVTVRMKTGPDEIEGRPAVEAITESFISAGFMLADELAKLDAMPVEVFRSLQRVTLSPDGCAHAKAIMFARDVLNALHDVTGFDRQQSGHMTIDRPSPSTEAGWHSLAAGIAPMLRRLRNRLVEIDSPNVKELQLVMSDEREKAKSLPRPSPWSVSRSPSDWLKIFSMLNVDCRSLDVFANRRKLGTYHQHPDSTTKSVSLWIGDLPPDYSDSMKARSSP